MPVTQLNEWNGTGVTADQGADRGAVRPADDEVTSSFAIRVHHSDRVGAVWNVQRGAGDGIHRSVALPSTARIVLGLDRGQDRRRRAFVGEIRDVEPLSCVSLLRRRLRSDLPDTGPRLLTGSCLAAAEREDPEDTYSTRPTRSERSRPQRGTSGSRSARCLRNEIAGAGTSIERSTARVAAGSGPRRRLGCLGAPPAGARPTSPASEGPDPHHPAEGQLPDVEANECNEPSLCPRPSHENKHPGNSFGNDEKGDEEILVG
jgi:hypothetical protein